jgi:hypothetical protein
MITVVGTWNSYFAVFHGHLRDSKILLTDSPNEKYNESINKESKGLSLRKPGNT